MGFCGMLQTPSEYKINWVRVYQDKEDPKQKVGCSTGERPTRKFIEAHEEKYMKKGDVHPLKPIQNGGGSCSVAASTEMPLPESCGGKSRGICLAVPRPATCQCLADWTGPYCMNPTGYDDKVWDPIDKLSDIGFSGPRLDGGMYILLFLIVCALVGAFLVGTKTLTNKWRQRRMDGYTRVGSAAAGA